MDPVFVAALWEVGGVFACDSCVGVMNYAQIPAGYPAVPIELVGASILCFSFTALSHFYIFAGIQNPDRYRHYNHFVLTWYHTGTKERATELLSHFFYLFPVIW